MTSCMNASQLRRTLQPNHRESVQRIQAAVDAYQRNEHVLPLCTPAEHTPKYEKFKVDLQKLQYKGYLDEIPSIAFEKGGTVHFLIQNEQTKPTVKLLDLLTVQAVNDMQRIVQQYERANGGALPLGSEVYPDLYNIDLKRIKHVGPCVNVAVTSVYSGQSLPLLLHKKGNVYVDYAQDIIQILELKKEKRHSDRDARQILVDHADYVPAKSFSYVWKKGQLFGVQTAAQ